MARYLKVNMAEIEMSTEQLSEFKKEIEVKKEIIPYSAIQIYVNVSQFTKAFLAFFKAKGKLREQYTQSVLFTCSLIDRSKIFLKRRQMKI